MVFTIISDNTPPEGINLVPYIGEEGLDWQWNAVDGPETGRVMSALMERALIAFKDKCEVSLLWMPKETAVMIHKALMVKFLTVITDTIPWEEGTVTKTFYANNGKQACLTEYTDGTKLYGDLTFPLIER